LAQQSWSAGGSYSNGQTSGNMSGYMPTRHHVDNVGAEDGQFVFGFDRVTGLYFDRQKISYAGGNEDTYKSTSLNLLGVDASSPSQLPRFALDYVIASGFTAGIDLALATRSLSLSSDSAQQSIQPPTARPKGTTFLGGLRAGYAYPFDETFGVWPRAGLSYATSSADIDITDAMSGTTTTLKQRSHYFDLDLEALLVLSPVEHTAIMAGPFLDLGLGGKYSTTVAGVEDKRNASLTSFGLIVNAVGYY
jgi:hypothetical protein